MAQLIEKWEDLDYVPKAASTAFNVGDFISYNGTGEAKPLDPTEPVLGLCLEKITSSDSDYASIRDIPYQRAMENYKFLITVGAGTPTADNIGDTFDILSSDSSKLDCSASGTQFIIDRFISATTVVVRPVLLKPDLT